jgi:hypothetical protein
VIEITKTIRFKSKNDGREFEIKVPETSEDIENNEFVEINGNTVIAEEILFDDPHRDELSEKVPAEGELVYSVSEVYDLYYYNGEFYDFYWDTASGCIFSRLKELTEGDKNGKDKRIY